MAIEVPGKLPAQRKAVLLGPKGDTLLTVDTIVPIGPMRILPLDARGEVSGPATKVDVPWIAITSRL